jgi:hypothetical protein
MTKARQLRLRLGDPYTGGPADCWRTRHVSGPCGKCGAPMEPAHLPLHLAGLFCPRCCPCCGPVAIQVASSASVSSSDVLDSTRNMVGQSSNC